MFVFVVSVGSLYPWKEDDAIDDPAKPASILLYSHYLNRSC